MLNLKIVRWSMSLIASVGLAVIFGGSVAVAQEEKPAAVSADHDHAGDHKASHNPVPHDDPNHANSTPQTYQVVDFRTDLALFTAVVFLVLLGVLGATAWGPISKALEKREQMIASNIKSAEDAVRDAKAKLAEYENKLASAAGEAQQILADARKDAEATGQRLITAAQEEAARQRERALAEIESAKSIALTELAQKSTDVAMSLAGRIVGREVKASDHNSMIQDMLSNLPSKN
ncbi:MAG: F0F1 ATP synthase subunit B [Pirellulales bacterium]